MKRQTLLLLVIGLVSLIMLGLVHADTLTVRRVKLHGSNTDAFPGKTFVVEAVGTEGVGGAGTDLFAEVQGAYCDIHFDKVSVDAEGDSAVLTGKVVDAANPGNLGAFVQITAFTSNGSFNFVFQALTSAGAQTGAGGINFTGGSVSISNILP